MLIPGAGITERRASMERLQAPLCTPSSPDRSRLVRLTLGYTRTRLARPKPNQEPVCRLVSVWAKVLVDFCQTSKLAEMQPPISKLNPRTLCKFKLQHVHVMYVFLENCF